MILRVLNLGAGVQSTTMALMAAHGEITPMPDCAIFADTGWEPKVVYDHLAWLTSGNLLPFPVHIVSAGNLRDDVIARASGERIGRSATQIPFHLQGETGIDSGLMGRSCTRDYKISPIKAKIRELLGLKPGARAGSAVVVERWIGISLDEIERVKDADEKWIKSRWPLIESRMRRWDCLQWMRRHEYPEPPRSACIGCPHKSNAEWRALSPAEMADAADLEATVHAGLRFFGGLRAKPFLHRSFVPISEADIRSDEDKGQGRLGLINECEGMCGV